jgi:predicted O-linked N-acetylglucosamine transferase (SPINDLY family)
MSQNPSQPAHPNLATEPSHNPALMAVLDDFNANRYEEADAKIKAILGQSPTDATAWHVQSYVLTAWGQAKRDLSVQEQGLEAAKKALDFAPDNVTHRETYLTFLSMIRRPTEQLRVAKAWYESDPADLRAIWAYSGALHECCMFAEAREIFRQGAMMASHDVLFMGRRASFSNFDDGITAAERAMVHFEAGEAYANMPGVLPVNHANKPEPGRKLRIGVISPDFRNHSCAFFLEPLLANLDKNSFELYLYYTMGLRDEYTARFKAIAKSFRQFSPIPGATEGMGFKIWNDRIDILIDMAGHTDGNRLNVMQGFAAPVQATYLGYPNTTGLRAVGYRIVDSITDPPGSESLASEHLVRIDRCFLCYKPPAEAGRIDPTPPMSRPGSRGVTFGCFNNAMKSSPTAIGLWASALRAVPGSVIVLKSGSFADPTVHAYVLERFAAGGIGPERVIFEGATQGTTAHLDRYNSIDIALDPTPYNGTTTTCEALWMGVPVVTLLGDFHASRVSASILSAVGLADLAAKDSASFATVAAALAANPERLADLRRNLRNTMAASPLCDAPGHAARFGTALRAMWEAWCATKAAPR